MIMIMIMAVLMMVMITRISVMMMKMQTSYFLEYACPTPAAAAPVSPKSPTANTLSTG